MSCCMNSVISGNFKTFFFLLLEQIISTLISFHCEYSEVFFQFTVTLAWLPALNSS